MLDASAPLTLANWRDAAVVVTFIYLRCPLPQFCPLMDRRFAEVQRLVQDDVELRLVMHCRISPHGSLYWPPTD